MRFLTVLKNIYTRPQEAFDTAALTESLGEAIAWTAALWIAIAAWGTTRGLGTPLPGWQVALLSAFGVLAAVLMLAIFVWITRTFVRRAGGSLEAKAFLSGILWIGVATAPLGGVLALIPLTSARFLTWPWQFWLSVLLVQSLSGLGRKKSVGVTVLSDLLTIVAIVIPVAALSKGVLFLLRSASH